MIISSETRAHVDRQPFGVWSKILSAAALVAGACILPALIPGDAFGQMLSEPAEKPSLKLVVKNFRMISGTKRVRFLERALPELLQVGLLQNREIEIIPHGELWRVVRSMRLPDAQIHANRPFDDDVLGAVGANYLLGGVFFELGGSIQVQPVLHALKDGAERQLAPTALTVDAIFDGVREMSTNVAAALIDSRRDAGKLRKLAVTCSYQMGGGSAEYAPLVGRDVMTSLGDGLRASEDFESVDTSTAGKVCKEEDEPVALTRNLAVDASLYAIISSDEKHIEIAPRLHVTRKSEVHPIPAVSRAPDRYRLLKYEIAEVVEGYLAFLASPRASSHLPRLDSETLTPKELLALADEALDDGDATLALLYVRRAEERVGSRMAAARYRLGRIRAMQDRIKESLNEYRLAVELDPELGSAWAAIGKANLELGEFAEARDAYLEAKRLIGDDAEIDKRLAMTYLFSGQSGEAKALYSAARESNPQDVESLRALGYLELRGQNVTRAIEHLQEALRLTEPDSRTDREIRNELAQILAEQGRRFFTARDYQRAFEFFDQQVSVSPTIYAYLNRANARTYIALDSDTVDFEASINDYLMAVEYREKGSDLDAPVDLAMLSLAELYLFSGDDASALAWSEKALEQTPPGSLEEGIGQFLKVVSLILLNRDYQAELGSLRKSLSEKRFQGGYGWDLVPLENLVRSRDGVDTARLTTFLNLSEKIRRYYEEHSPKA